MNAPRLLMISAMGLTTAFGLLQVKAQSIFYEFTVIARDGMPAPGGGTLGGVEPNVSVNEHGQVAFVGAVTSGTPAVTFQQLFVGDTAMAPVNVSRSPTFRNFDFPQINNQGQVVTRELSGGHSVVRVWESRNPGAFSMISTTTITPFSQLTLPTLGNTADPRIPPLVSFLGRIADLTFSLYENDNLTPNVQTMVSPLTGTRLASYRSASASSSVRTLVAQFQGIDDGAPQAGFQRLVAFEDSANNGLWSGMELAGTGSGQPWTELGLAPGISDSGKIIAFLGRHAAEGEGIWIGASSNNFASPPALIKVIGTDDIIACDESGQPIRLREFDFTNKVAVLHQTVAGGSGGFDRDVLTLAFVATPERASMRNPADPSRRLVFSGQQALWTLRVDFESDLAGTNGNPPNPAARTHPASPIPVVQVLDTIDGAAVESISLYDPLSLPETAPDGNGYWAQQADHYIAFSVSTPDGTKIVRGAHLDPDQDGLLSHWETRGIDMDGDGTVELDLPALGADPLSKDIFLEIDWLDDRTAGVAVPYSNRPAPGMTQRLARMYADEGITLHVDAGPGTHRSGLPWSVNMPDDPTLLKGGSAIRYPGNEDSHIDVLYMDGHAPTPVPGVVARSFFDVKKQYFGVDGLRAREFAFKYAVMADFYEMIPSVVPDGLAWLGRVGTAGPDFLDVAAASPLPAAKILDDFGAGALKITQGRGAGQVRVISGRTGNRLMVREPWATVPDNTSLVVLFGTSSGLGEAFFRPEPNNHGRPGNDVIISFGGWPINPGGWLVNGGVQWRTLAHELGHTFALRHGGIDHEQYRGNAQLSLMSYSWQTAVGSGVNSYSHGGDTLGFDEWGYLKYDFFRTGTMVGSSALGCPFPRPDLEPVLPPSSNVDVIPPVVVITSPVDHNCAFAVAQGTTLNVTATASDNVQVSSIRLQFDINGDGDQTDPGESATPVYQPGPGHYLASFANVRGAAGIRTILAYAFDSSDNMGSFATPVAAGSDTAGVATLATRSGSFAAQAAAGSRQRTTFTGIVVPSSGHVLFSVTGTPPLRQTGGSPEQQFEAAVEKITVGGRAMALRPASNPPGCNPAVSTTYWQAPAGGGTMDVEVSGPARLNAKDSFLGAPAQSFSLKVTFQAVDLTPPGLTFAAPGADAFIETGEPLEVRVNATDDFSVARVDLAFDVNGDGDDLDAGEKQQAASLGGGVFRVNYGALGGLPGVRAIKATATDTAGLTVSKTTFITVKLPDTAAPVVVIRNPPAGWPVKQGDPLRVEVSAYDDIRMDSVEIRFDIDGNGNTSGAGETVTAPLTGINTYSTTFAALAGATGPRTVQVTARDKAGNSSPASTPVTVISTVPVSQMLFTQNGVIPASAGAFNGGSQRVVDFNPITVPRSGILTFTVTGSPPVRNATQNVPRADPYLHRLWFNGGAAINLTPTSNAFGSNPSVYVTTWEAPQGGSLDFQILGPGQWNIWGEWDGHAAQNYTFEVKFTPTDRTLPTVNVTSPTLGSNQPRNAPLTVNLTVTDDVSVASVVVGFDLNGDGDSDDSGEQMAAASLGSNNYRASFGNVTGGPGPRTILIQATDTAFNTTRREHSVGVDGVGTGETILLTRTAVIPSQRSAFNGGTRTVINHNGIALPGMGRVTIRVTAWPNARSAFTNLERHDPAVWRVVFNGTPVSLTPVVNPPGSNPAYAVSTWDSPGAGTLDVQLLGSAEYNTFGEFEGSPQQDYQMDVAFFPGPSVTSVAPAGGATGGHEPVTLRGTGFADKAVVLFGDVPATEAVRVSSTELRCLTPPGVNGAVAVTVLNPDFSGITHSFNYGSPYGLFGKMNNAFTYSTPAQPPVSAFGERLIGTWRGAFGPTAKEQARQQITQSFPIPGAGQVRFEVYAFVPILTAIPGPFERPDDLLWHNASTAVTSFRNAAGTNQGLFPDYTDLRYPFGPVIANSTGSVPAGGTANFTLQGPARWNAFWREFGDYVMESAPAQSWAVAAWYVNPHSVTGATPTRGPVSGGTLVTIRGTNFASPATVRFGQHLATNVVVTDATTITCRTPQVFGPAVVDLTVTVDGRPAGLSTAYRFVQGTEYCIPAPDHLASWWRGEGNARDARGPNHGTFRNGATTGAGLAGQGFVFDGVNDFVEIPVSGLNVGTGDFTIEGWVKTTDTGSYNSLISFDTYTPVLNLLAAGNLQFYPAAPSQAMVLNDGQWHHFAAVRRSGTLTYYKDGAAAGSVAYPNALNPQRGALGSSNPTTGGDFLQGSLDEVDFYRTALTESEIRLIFLAGADGKCRHDADGDDVWDEWETANGFNPASAADGSTDADGDGLTNLVEFQIGTNPRDYDSDGDGVGDGPERAAGSDPLDALIYPPDPNAWDLLAFWDFNNTSTPNTSADVAHGYQGTFLGDGKFSAAGGGRTGTAADYAADFTGTGNGRLEVPDARWLNIAGITDRLTVTFWQKLTAITTGTTFHAVSPSVPLGRGAHAHSPWSDRLLYWDTAGHSDSSTRIMQAPAASFDFLTWHHFAFVKNGDTKEIWIDGVRLISGVNTQDLPRDMTKLFLGAHDPAAGSSNWQMQGYLDDVAIFADALGSAQIQRLAAGTSPLTLAAEPPPPFRIGTFSFNPATRAVSLTWNSLANTTYTLQSSVDLITWQTVQANITSQGASTSATHTAPAGIRKLFYRVLQGP